MSRSLSPIRLHWTGKTGGWTDLARSKRENQYAKRDEVISSLNVNNAEYHNSRWLELENVFHNNNSMNLNVVAGRATLAIPYILDKHTFPYYLYLIPYNI